MTRETPDSRPTLTDARVAELIVSHARDYAIFALDLQGSISSWGQGAEKMTGYTADEALGADFAILFTPSDQAAGQPRSEIDTAWREGRAEDTRWHVRKNGERFWANGVTVAFRDGAVQGVIKVLRDETPGRLAEERRVLLLNELNHRINNTLVTVQSLVEQTLRAGQVDEGVRENIANRLVALSEAHKVLVEQNWAGADLRTIVAKALTPYRLEDGERLKSDGPAVRLSAHQAVSMSLVLHELATNSVKYGSLSASEGYVEVSWNINQDGQGNRRLTFLWQERAGPPVAEPTRRGFGSRLISRTLGEGGDGHAEIHFDPAGVRCVVTLFLSKAEEEAMLDLGASRDAPG